MNIETNQINIGIVHLCKPWICRNFTFLHVQLSIVLMLWLGLRIKKNLARFRKRLRFGLKNLLWSPHSWLEMP